MLLGKNEIGCTSPCGEGRGRRKQVVIPRGQVLPEVSTAVLGVWFSLLEKTHPPIALV